MDCAHVNINGAHKHLCPEHQAAYTEWLARREAREAEKQGHNVGERMEPGT